MTNESNFPAVFFEDFLAALRKVQDENRIHGNVEVFELRPSPDGAVHLGVSWPPLPLPFRTTAMCIRLNRRFF